MEITEVKIRKRDVSDGKLKAYVSITIDNAFVVRDIKIIEGKNGLFVAMPSMKLSIFCPKCKKKNPVGSRFCNQCGASMEGATMPVGPDGLPEEHRDIAHPITTEARDYIQKKVLDAYNKEA
jgi:stage V sporulation protein G